jgi:hypothetical protein
MTSIPNGNKTNGAVVANGAVSEKSKPAVADTSEKLASKAKPKPKPRKFKSTKADKEGVANALEQHGQIVHARIKPLPNQIGSGTFDERPRWGKLKNDLKHLRSAGMWRMTE